MLWPVLLAEGGVFEGAFQGAMRGAIMGGIAGALLGVVLVVSRFIQKRKGPKEGEGKSPEPPS